MEQIYQVGVRSLPLILLLSLAVGLVMALQFGVGLERFGGKLYIPKIVTVSIVRELGPIFICLLMAGRVAAGFASEIGSMVVTQQIDAIRALGTSPIKIIVIPRILACLIAVPLLTALGNVVGILGGLIVGVLELGLDSQFYYQKAISAAALRDYMSGFGKSIFFGLFIAIPACYYGLKVRGGTKGVGRATTQAVVVSSILIILGDFILTKFFMIFER
jgi:phospholipid/cholesterol/gamma-HCH transport system permease protein